VSKPRFLSSRVLICLAALLLLLILGGCSSGVSDGGELGGGGSIGGGGGGGGNNNNPDPPTNPGDPIPVLGTSATLNWSPASGPVFGYQVETSRNGGSFGEGSLIAGPSVTLTGAAGDVVRVRVAAFDSERNLGPMSAPSDPFVFLGNTTTPSGGGESSGAGSGSGSGSGGSGPVAGGSEGSGSTEEPPATPGEAPADPDAGSPFALAGDDLVWQSQDGAHVRVTSADLTRARLYSLPEGDHRLVAVADFDGDGAADLLFASQGELALAHGSALAAGPGALALETWAQLPSGAEFAASGDFDGDGAADAVVVQGLDASLWLAAGDVLALPAAWYEARVVGAGDADADGSADLLWRGGDGNLVLWRIAGGALASESPVTLPEGAAFVTFADLDGNGSAEVASQSAPDALGVSQAVAPFSGWAEAAPSGAALAGCGDYDGDGTRDRLWTDAAGLRVVTASGEHAVPQDELGDWRLFAACK
jgi:hypothetical protein